MEKTIPLDQREMQSAAAIERELTQMWAQVGILSEQLEQARRLRDQVLERQRGFIRQAVTDHGIERYENARLGPGGIVVTLPDTAESGSPQTAPRANGAPAIDAG